MIDILRRSGVILANRKVTAAARIKMERAQMICPDRVHARGASIIYDRECGALVSTAGLTHVPEMPEMRL
jgi:hypothetical protein